MRRRQFMTVLGGAAAGPLGARAQQPKVAKLGFVSWQSQAAADQVEYLRDGLARLGSQLPVIADFLAFAKVGALFSLGVEEADLLRRVAYFADRILKGVKPADLPVEQPTTFRLTVNVRTANALGWTIPPLVVARADEVIE